MSGGSKEVNNNQVSIFLRDLRERLRSVPANAGINDWDIDRLTRVAQWVDNGHDVSDIPDDLILDDEEE